MTLKKLLGLEDCPLHEREIIEKLEEARKNNIEVVEFSFNGNNVKITTRNIDPVGIMRGWPGHIKDSR
jgi:hypothetical protein